MDMSIPAISGMVANPFIALCWVAALFAAFAWLRVWRRLSALSERGQQPTGVWSLVEPAAMFTSAAMFLGVVAWIWQAFV